MADENRAYLQLQMISSKKSDEEEIETSTTAEDIEDDEKSEAAYEYDAGSAATCEPYLREWGCRTLHALDRGPPPRARAT